MRFTHSCASSGKIQRDRDGIGRVGGWIRTVGSEIERCDLLIRAERAGGRVNIDQTYLPI